MKSLRIGSLLIMSLAMSATSQVSSSPDASIGKQPSSNTDPSETKGLVSEKPATGATTMIKINGAEAGEPFGGVGAISGGGGNSRLLIDYPPTQRREILDYLFKPGFGASLQILKLEIGGDANSTDGSEPSVEHTPGVVNCNAGYEFWLAEQAKLRNPNIKLYGLAWAAPGWIDHHSFWSKETIDYLMTWMDCAHSHGLKIDYLGGWNERGYDKTWYENLHAALAEKHYATQVVGDDSGWKVADDMVKDFDFAKSIEIIGVHYSCQGGDGGSANTCHSTQNGIATKKPLWDSESGSQDENTGTGPLIRAITRGYIDAKMTGFLNWPLAAAITSNLPYSTVGLLVASQPWSGNYSIGSSLWATAQVTQFSQPGWHFLNQASGYLANDRTNGSYVTLASPDGSDYSTIVETTTAKVPSLLTIDMSANVLKKHLHVWATNLNSQSGKDLFVHVSDPIPDSLDQTTVTLLPGYIYTFSTMQTAGKGTATSPNAGTLPLPYRDNFDKYKPGQEARYLSDMQGSFEIQRCAAGRSGKCLQQMASTKPIEWQDDSDAFALLGDPSWTDYAISIDAEFARPGTIELIGRAGTQKRPQSHQQGYYLRVSDTGDWSILKSDSRGKHTILGQGSIPPLGVALWHRLRLSLANHQIAAYVDEEKLAAITDDSYGAGQIGVGLLSYDTDQFDNLSITPISDGKP